MADLFGMQDLNRALNVFAILLLRFFFVASFLDSRTVGGAKVWALSTQCGRSHNSNMSAMLKDRMGTDVTTENRMYKIVKV